ncbi:MAG: MFS transporter [Parachlamydiales bacterium]|nr:MFS transporter [Parachlamydiales bacterium]
MSPKVRHTFSLFSLFFTLFNDLIGWSIVLVLFAPLILNSQFDFLPQTASLESRTIVLGLLLGCYGFAQFFSATWLGTLSDRYGRRFVLMVSVAGSFLSYVFAGFAVGFHSLTLLFLSRLLGGLFAGNQTIVSAAVGDVSDNKHRARNMSRISTVGGLAWIIGSPLGGKLSDNQLISWFNYSTPFWFLALLFFINLICIFIGFKETYKPQKPKNRSVFGDIKELKWVMKQHPLKTTLITTFVFQLGWFFFLLFYPAYMVERFGMNASEIGDYSGFFAICYFAGSYLYGRFWAKHFNPENSIFTSSLILGLAVISFIIPANPNWFYLIMIFCGIFGATSFINCVALLSKLAGKEKQGAVFGIQGSLQSIGFFISPFLAGLFAATHPLVPMVIGCLLILASALYFRLKYRFS